jgi:drug/metabolite transporter (DMT)-like permease
MGFLWVAIFSQYLGFYFWYRGLARGGIASVGQVQLLQTFLTLGFSALLLGEALDPWMLAAAAGTLLCILAARATR